MGPVQNLSKTQSLTKIIQRSVNDAQKKMSASVIWILMWLHRHSEEPAPTSVICYWKKPVLSQVGLSLKFMKALEIGKIVKKPRIDTRGCDEVLDAVINMAYKH